MNITQVRPSFGKIPPPLPHSLIFKKIRERGKGEKNTPLKKRVFIYIYNMANIYTDEYTHIRILYNI